MLAGFAMFFRKPGRKTAENRDSGNLARSLQFPLHPPDGPAAKSRRSTMTLNLTNVQSVAVSLFGALIAATLFISAAIGPAGQLI
jgi:hypothetical protein